MKTTKFLFLLVAYLALACSLFGAYLTNVPMTIEQPDGSVLECFVSGDEYHNWLHDEEGYTIIQCPTTGFYVYAERGDKGLIAGSLIAGSADPKTIGLTPNINLTRSEYLARRAEFEVYSTPTESSVRSRLTGTINNIVIYIRFSDQEEFTLNSQSEYDKFNSTDPTKESMRNFFTEASYGIVDVITTMLPTQNQTTIVSYQDIHPRDYYVPYNEVTNPQGYHFNDGDEARRRVSGLASRALNFVELMIPSYLNLDANGDGYVDNIAFVVRGSITAWGSILSPHKSSLSYANITLRGMNVGVYNLIVEAYDRLSVYCHELTHTFGAPDFYHFGCRANPSIEEPVGPWDLMARDYLQHPSSFTKWKYLGWLDNIPFIGSYGNYTLNSLLSPTGNSLRIPSPNSSTEYFIVEYRHKEGLYESNLRASGLVVWRVNTEAGEGNRAGPPDELFVLRDQSWESAALSSNIGTTIFNDNTRPGSYLSDGSPGGIQIQDVGNIGETISFYYGDFHYHFSVNPILEKFDGPIFPTIEAENVAIAGSRIFTQVNSGINPSCSPVSRSYMMSYTCRGNASGNSAYYAFPRIRVEQANTNRYSVSFKMYRNSSYSASADRIEVYRNTTQDLNGSPVLLGTVHRSLALSPADAIEGWKKNTFEFTPLTNGDYHIILKAVSGNGNNIFIDDVEFERHCQALVVDPFPANNSTSITVNPTFTWNFTGLIPDGYRFFLGTNNPPTSIVDNKLIESGQSYTHNFSLAANTRYYWRVVPFDEQDAGLATESYTFVTASIPPITELPYLEDFEHENMTMAPGWSIVNANNIRGDWRQVIGSNRNRYIFVNNAPGYTISGPDLDDWVISPGIDLVAGSDYHISFLFRRASQYGVVKAAVYASTSSDPENQKTLIYQNENIGQDNSDFSPAECFYTAVHTGTHYFMIRATGGGNTIRGLAIDDFKIVGIISAEVNNIYPADNEMLVSVNGPLSWELTTGSPTGYYLNIGTNNPPTNLYHRLNVGNILSWIPSESLSYQTEYYWQIIPYSATGEVVDSPVWSFRSEAESAITLPYSENFDSVPVQNLPVGYLSFRNDDQSIGWRSDATHSSSSPHSVASRRGEREETNSWLVMPSVRLFAGSDYRLSFKYRAEVYYAREKLKIAYGFFPSVETLTNVFYTDTEIENEAFQTANVDFSPDEDGVFFIGFNHFSDSSIWRRLLYLDDIELTAINEPLPVFNHNPDNNTTGLMINRQLLSWQHTGDVTGYKLNLGTDNPPTNIFNGLDLGFQKSFEFPDYWNYATQYYWQIIPYNSAGDSPDSPIYSFVTMNESPITVLPYFEDFESVALPNLPNGYFNLDRDGDNSTWSSVDEDSKGLRVNSNLNRDSDDWLYLPALTQIKGAEYFFNFDYRLATPDKTVGLKVLTGTYPSPEHLQDELYVNNEITYSGSMSNVNLSFIAESDDLLYIGIQFTSSADQGYLLFDNIAIERTPAPVVSAVPRDGMRGTSYYPTFSWDEVAGNPDGYRFYLGTDNPPTDIINGLDLAGIREFQVLEPLQHSTVYYWQVKPYNYLGSSGSCPVFSFTVMEVNTVTSMPYNEDFELEYAPSMPLNWKVFDQNEDGISWKPTSVNPRSSSYCVTIGPSSQQMNDWMITTPIFLEKGLTYRLSYYARKENPGTSEILKVYYGNAQHPEAMTNLLRIASVPFSDYTLNLKDFSPDESGAYYIGFMGSSIANQGSIYIDDFGLGLITDPYRPPRNLTAAASYTSIVLNWEAPSGSAPSSYKIFRNGMMIANVTSSENPYEDFSALSGENYLYYVKSVYTSPSGESDTSNHVYTRLYIEGIVLDSPTKAQNPNPEVNETEVSIEPELTWDYTSHPAYTDPIGYLVKIGTHPMLGGADEIYVTGGVGTNSLVLPFSLPYNAQYYWQVIPTAGDGQNAFECPIWSFTTQESSGIISEFPYLETFFWGERGWTTGGTALWELGTPNQTMIDHNYFGQAWMTGLSVDYPNGADSWLMSPPFDFSEVEMPKLLISLSIWCETNWDGMVLESSIDGTATWQKVISDGGFYNNFSTSGPLAPPKWSGYVEPEYGIWDDYITTLPDLANQESVFLRFRFVSDGSIVSEGVAFDLIRIWDSAAQSFVIDPTSYDFGHIPRGTVTEEIEFYIMNDGFESRELQPSDIQIVGTGAGDFILRGFDEPITFGPYDGASVFVSFAPQSLGTKNASLVISQNSRTEAFRTTRRSTREDFRNRSETSAPLSGIGIINSLSWSEDFASAPIPYLPTGWNRDSQNWKTSSSNQAGGTAPELQFNWEPRVIGDYYVWSLPLNTTGISNLALSFRHSVDHWSGDITIKVVTVEGTNEHLVKQWVNPGADIPAERVEYSLTTAHGVGSADLRIAWIFSGDSFNINDWFIDDIQITTDPAPPTAAESPTPADGAVDISLAANLEWTYISDSFFTDPTGFYVKIARDPSLEGSVEVYQAGGPGSYSIESPLDLLYGTTYYWQVIPTTDSRSTSRSDFQARISSGNAVRNNGIRTNAEGCPIWSFQTEEFNLEIANYPYTEDFESALSGWKSGAVAGENIWELGAPVQDNIDTAKSGTNSWMTRLNLNYPSDANSWLKSPQFDFSSLTHPMFSFWLNSWCEPDFDGMILESSIDGGNSWHYVSGSSGFYNIDSSSLPIGVPRWSGLSGDWVKYSTPLDGLEHQPSVYLRFRFRSNFNLENEGIAIDDVTVWNSDEAIFSISPTAHDFGTAAVGGIGQTQDFQIINLGAGTLTINPEDIRIIGENADEFYLHQIPNTILLNSAESYTITVGMAPNSAGVKAAQLEINDNLTVSRNIVFSNSRIGYRERISSNRALNQIPLDGTAFEPTTYSLPWSEDFSGVENGLMPADWDRTGENWSVQDTAQSGGDAPEMKFNFFPLATSTFSAASPLIDTSGMNELSFSFQHRINHNDGNYTLRVKALVGKDEYPVEEWENPVIMTSAQTTQFTLTSSEHGVGSDNFRLVWEYSGNSTHINQWTIDNIKLEPEKPIVITGSTASITHQSATLNANITKIGSTPISSRGFYYGTDPDPYNNGEIIVSDSVTNSFSVQTTGLTADTVIFYQAFAVNGAGESLGSVLSFTTMKPQLTVSVAELPDFGELRVDTSSEVKTFTISGEFLPSDVELISTDGFILSTGETRLLSNTVRSSTRIRSNLILTPVAGKLETVTIEVRFQPTETGNYSDNIRITTQGISDRFVSVSGKGIDFAVLTTNPVLNITQTEATSGGVIVSDGESTVSLLGVCWSESPDPTIDDNYTEDDETDGSFTSILAGLQPNTTYYLRAYAINGAGVAYGTQLSFTTLGTALPSPQNLTITIVGGAALLNWDSVTNATAYRIYRTTDPNLSDWGTPVDTTSLTTWVDSEQGSLYFYRVTAVDDLVR